MRSRKGIIYLDYSVDGKRYRKTTKLPDTRENIALVKREVVPQLRASIARGEYKQTAKQFKDIARDRAETSDKFHAVEKKMISILEFKDFFNTGIWLLRSHRQ